MTERFLERISYYNALWPCFGSLNGVSSYIYWRHIVLDMLAPSNDALQAELLSNPQFDILARQIFHYYETSEAWSLIPSALSSIQSLSDMNIHLAVISNWDDRLHNILAGFDLPKYFQAVILSHEVGVEKPDVRIFEIAEQSVRKQSSVQQSNFQLKIHIGDNLKKDGYGAIKAGWTSIVISEHPVNHISKNLFVVSNMSQAFNTCLKLINETKI